MSLRACLSSTAAVLAAVLVSTAPSSASRAATAAADAPAAVGPLFSLTPDGHLGNHFCTATVVDSAHGDLVATAAHCLQGQTVGKFAFVPGYRNGIAPLGVWVVTRAFVDRAWSTSASPDDDFAFLVTSPPPLTARLEALTGAERVGGGEPVGRETTVVGYPSASDTAIACSRALGRFTATQMEFDCDGYTPGTSGSALVVGADPRTGLGTLVGVIGGYQEGGDTPAVSYAATFGTRARALYELAAR